MTEVREDLGVLVSKMKENVKLMLNVSFQIVSSNIETIILILWILRIGPIVSWYRRQYVIVILLHLKYSYLQPLLWWK